VIVTGGEPDPPRLVPLRAALATSALVHGLAILLAVRVGSGPLEPPLVAIPVSLVALTGSGGGDAAAPGAADTPAPTPAAAPLPAPEPPHPVPHRTARRGVSRTPTREDAVPSGRQAGGPGNGAGGGGGPVGVGGGDGSGGTGAAYGANPLPPYPLVARRLGMEGVVLLEVVVAPDGHAADVRVAKSSGYPALDASAVATVRDRWRFVPARRDGVPVESRVTVPIRFKLEA